MMVEQQEPSVDPRVGEGLDLREYWDVIVRRRRVILGCAVLVALAGLIMSLLIRPVYTATATLQIEQDSPSILGFETLFSERTYYDDFFDTQVQIIRSRSLAERVIDREALMQNPQALGLRSDSAGVVVGTVTGWIGDAVIRVRELIGTATPPIERRGASGPDREREEEEALRSRAVQALTSGISVRPVEGTHLAHLSWSGSHPVTAATVTNAIVDVYIDMSLEAKYDAAEEASQFLTEAIERLESEIAELQSEMQRFGSERDIVSLNDRQTTVQQRLADLSTQHSQAQTERMLKQMEYERLTGSDPVLPPDAIANNPRIGQLEAEYRQLEQQYSEMSVRFTDEWPEMERLRDQMEAVQDRIEAEKQRVVDSLAETARQAYESALLREENLKQALDQQKREAMNLSRDLTSLENTRLTLQTKQQTLQQLLTRQSETGVSARLQGMRTSSIRRVDEARPPASPSHPDIPLNVGVASILGLLLGLGIAFVQDRLDNTLHTPDDVEHRIRLPNLGLVPALSSVTNGNRRLHGGYAYEYAHDYGDEDGEYTQAIDGEARPELITLEHPRSALAEAYRNLRTGVLLSRAGGHPKTIMVTSTEPQEGKTTSSLNLALSLAQAGKRVLIVDGDMRRPSLHRLLNVDSTRGLTHYLTGGATLEEAAQPVGRLQGLWLMPAGPRPPNPAELLTSDRMVGLLEEAAKKFDLVIIDTPPVMAAVDPLIIAPEVDGVLMVIKGGATPSPIVERACRKIEGVRGRFLGALLNHVVPEKVPYYRYGERRRYS